jgi:hypothetical protein
MTAQIGDTFTYENENYSIVACSEPIIFHPLEYGILPKGTSTCCYDGYWCEFNIAKSTGLGLHNLHINSGDGKYPKINGVNVNKDSEDHMGLHTYENINRLVAYTGKIVLGKEFIDKYYIHMGYQWPWAYKKLIEFDFKAGKLEKVVDHSKVAAYLRQKIDDNPEKYKESLYGNDAQFVEECFSTDLDIKAWWINEEA